jgi:small subunit ribosomal protein S6
MNTYRFETIYITRPELDEEARTALCKKFEGVVQKNKGKVVVTENWGKQRLAYDVKKQMKGNYHYVGFEGTREVMLELERNLKINEGVIKFQTHRVEGEFDAVFSPMGDRERPFKGGGYKPFFPDSPDKALGGELDSHAEPPEMGEDTGRSFAERREDR